MSENAKIIGVIVIPSDYPGKPSCEGWMTPLHNNDSALSVVLQRVKQISGLAEIVLTYEQELPLSAIASLDLQGIKTYQSEQVFSDNLIRDLSLGRKWCSTGWRGGIAGNTIFDEVIYPKALTALMDHYQADAAYVIGADWPLHDVGIADQMIERFTTNLKPLEMVFTQAPPGVAGMIISARIVKELAANNGWVGRILEYVPNSPQSDPISKRMCVIIPHELRNMQMRFITDTPRWTQLIQDACQQLGTQDSILEYARHMQSIRRSNGWRLPKMLHLELTTRRLINGPITPQGHVTFEREDINTDLALCIIDQLAEEPDALLTFGGLGDPMLHPDALWIIDHARLRGIFGVNVETDLLDMEDQLENMIKVQPDVISVWLNADTPEVYEKVMGVDRLKEVRDNAVKLMELRNKDPKGKHPYIVPRFMKTRDNLKDMESFFDRSMMYALHGVIDRFDHGNGLIEDQSPLDMSANERPGLRPDEIPMVIHSNGKMVYNKHDWLDKEPIGDLNLQSLETAQKAFHQAWHLRHMRLFDILDHGSGARDE